MDMARKVLAIRKESILKSRPTLSRNQFNSSIETKQGEYDYSSPDNYLESKRSAGWSFK